MYYFFSPKGQYSDAMERNCKRIFNLYCSVKIEFYCKAPFWKYEWVGDAIFCQWNLVSDSVFPIGGYVSKNVSMMSDIYFFSYDIK